MSPRAPSLAGIVADVDTMTEAEVYHGTPEQQELVKWLAWHGIDANSIPAGARVSRDACCRCIRYVAIVRDDAGRPRQHGPDDRYRLGDYVVEPLVEQGEAPPLPYPELIARALR